MKNEHQNRGGFSLVELIIVIAILAALVAILAPQYAQYVAKSRAAVCHTNCANYRRELNLALLLDEEPDTEEISSRYVGSCPDGGTITTALSGGRYNVTCSIHGGVELSAADKTLNSFAELIAQFKYDKANLTPQQMATKYGFSYESNDKLREYFKNAVLGGSWDTITVNGSQLYVQPFYNNTGEVLVYARNGNEYYTSYIYNPEDGQWYSGKGGISLPNQSWEQIKAAMNKNNWQPVEVE